MYRVHREREYVYVCVCVCGGRMSAAVAMLRCDYALRSDRPAKTERKRGGERGKIVLAGGAFFEFWSRMVGFW